MELRTALVAAGITKFPYFNWDEQNITFAGGLQIEIVFFFGRNKADYRVVGREPLLRTEYQSFPSGKDIDNMLKFIMDAFHGVIYNNDNIVVNVRMEKKFVSEKKKERGDKTIHNN